MKNYSKGDANNLSFHLIVLAILSMYRSKQKYLFHMVLLFLHDNLKLLYQVGVKKM